MKRLSLREATAARYRRMLVAQGPEQARRRHPRTRR